MYSYYVYICMYIIKSYDFGVWGLETTFGLLGPKEHIKS